MASRGDEPMIDWYAQLGVAPDATPSEIDAAYRRLARALHPDSGDGDDCDVVQFQRVVEAHDVLSDPARRRAHDALRQLRRDVDRSDRRVACPVCRGTRTIATPCAECRGTASVFASSPWLTTARPCRACRGTGRRPTPCGACAGTGYRSRAANVGHDSTIATDGE